ncbi:hypothetical protein DdX_09278 [Ditylenchus destructor]|uniref:Uncharacterized protein n=1 Tax=Ditylenchus destructor TaxID=166010 RepID=A0AAD4N6F6_9BILA|nr:hypothetical protein DdX_09278 [Ditylenchus destructor]
MRIPEIYYRPIAYDIDAVFSLLLFITAEIRCLKPPCVEFEEQKRQVETLYEQVKKWESQLLEEVKNNLTDICIEQHRQRPRILVHFNQRMQMLQAHMDAIFDQMEAISKKRQPIVEKIEMLESKLGINEQRKPEINTKVKVDNKSSSDRQHLLKITSTPLSQLEEIVTLSLVIARDFNLMP